MKCLFSFNQVLVLVCTMLLTGCGGDPYQKKLNSELKLLKSGNAEDRLNAALHIADIPKIAEQAVPALTAALDDPEAKVRAAAASTLARIGKSNAATTKKLLKLVAEDTDDKVVSSAASCLQTIGSKSQQAEAYNLMMESDSARRRTKAVMGVISLGDDLDSIVPILKQGLADPDDNVRMYSAATISLLGKKAKSLLPELQKLQKDKVDFVRDAATRAIQAVNQ